MAAPAPDAPGPQRYGSVRANNQPTGFDILARAKRARHPGVVFARAAELAKGETLTDDYSRLFAGLGV